jgi:hypothetical protein
VLAAFFGVSDETQVQYWTGTFLTLVFIAIVFASYSGRTLDFQGSQAPAPQGTLLSAAIGLLNGYLIAGTLWYYQDVYGYPLQRFFDLDTNLTERAAQMVQYLPPVLFADYPVLWMLPVAILLILRVKG